MLYSADRPEVHEIVMGLRRVLDEYEDRVLIGEIYRPAWACLRHAWQR
jgi:alpha-glucosidase